MSRVLSNNRGYRRGAVMGLTLAEAFVLISFALLMLLALWHFQVRDQAARLSQLEDLSEADIVAIHEMIEANQLDAARRLVSNGLDLNAGSGLPDEADRWRLIDKDELLRVLDTVEDLPEETQRDLADLVEIADSDTLALIIDETRRYVPRNEADDPLATIGAIFDRSQALRDATVARLRETLGDQLSRLDGATIRNDGTIVLPESVAFGLGSAQISPALRAYLRESCEPWLETLMESPRPSPVRRLRVTQTVAGLA